MATRLGRITRPAVFSEILQYGRRTRHGGLVVAYRQSLDARARLGFAVGRSAGCAVQRNRFRRVVREHLRRIVLPNVEFVVTVRGSVRGLSNAAIREHIEIILKKNGWLS